MSLSKHSHEGGNSIDKVSDIARIIDKRLVRMRCLLSVMIGLPNSGTSSLLMQLLEREGQIEDSNGLDIYETILLNDYVNGESELVDLTNHDDRDDAIILYSLAKFLVTKHYTIKDLEFDNKVEYHHVTEKYFQQFCGKLQSFMKQVKDSINLKVSLTMSHGFVSFFDINVNKAVYEIVFILGSTYSSIILFSVLNIFNCTQKSLQSPLNLADKFYGGKYKGENLHLFKLHTALQYIVHTIEAAFGNERKRGNAILVGTHADKFESQEELQGRLKHLYTLIDDYAQGLKIDEALASSKIFRIANLKGSVQGVEKLKQFFFDLINKDRQFEEYVPMKFLFFRCLLKSTKKMYISLSELKELAKNLIKEKEISEFLDLFRKNCSLFLLNTDVDSYVVLKPDAFIKGLDRLYMDRESLSSEDLASISNGYLPKTLAVEFWGNPGDSSSNYNFYTSVLTTFDLMVEIDSKCFFVPSIRSKYDTSKPTCLSDSLYTTYTISLLPFHKQCQLLKFFRKRESGNCKLELTDCSDYNVIKFACSHKDAKIAEVFVLFRCNYLELSIKSFSACKIPSAVYSYLKTTWARFLNTICKDLPRSDFHYNFAVVCPNSTEDSPHFVEFYPTHTDPLKMECKECRQIVDCSSCCAKNWIEAVCEDAIQPPDVIDFRRLTAICDQLSELTIENVKALFMKMNPKEEKLIPPFFNAKVSEVLFDVLYKWHCRNPTATKGDLAKLLQDCELHNEALRLDYSLHTKYIAGGATEDAEVSTDFNFKEIVCIADSWDRKPQELAELLSISAVESTSREILEKWVEKETGDKRTKLAELFLKNEYPRIAEYIYNELPKF